MNTFLGFVLVCTGVAIFIGCIYWLGIVASGRSNLFP